MALPALYKQFLAAPSSSALAQNASLHYITTTTSFYGPTDIIKHLSSQRNQIKKNKEDLLTVIQGQNDLAFQTELSLEFQDSGGAYLPGLDDQFLSDRTVHIAVVSVGHTLLFPALALTWTSASYSSTSCDSTATAKLQPFSKAGTRDHS